MRKVRRWIVLSTFVGCLAFAILGISGARAPVRIADYSVRAAAMPCSSEPFRVVVLGDLHVSSLTTDPAHIRDAVAKVNALKPDLVLMVGDYFSRWWPSDEADRFKGLMPLAGLRSRLGTVAILGNNDIHDGASQIKSVLARVGVVVLDNDVFVTPEVAIMGIAEITSNTANPVLVEERYAAKLSMARIAPPPLTIWLAHNPVMFDRVTATGDMLFAGHTHGGQILPGITLPVIHAIVWLGRMFGFEAGWPAEHYVRGFYHAGPKRMIVTSGVGESGLPLRLGVPPEIALVRFTGCDRARVTG